MAAAVIEIPLRGRSGQVRAVALVDDEDQELAELRWCLAGDYVKRRDGKRFVFLHREIMGLKAGDPREVDHENGNPLDCRRSNMRVVTHAQNQQNLTKARGRSAFRGVAFHKASGLWRARATAGKVSITRYAHTEEEAGELARELRADLMPFAVEPERVG